jgi:cytochrome d ubiquinol oxidase subunit II
LNAPLYSSFFVAFALMLYVLLDGFDLGVGSLLLFERNEHLRDQMMDSITPTWDGNETWLVMAALVLLGAFPIAYGILLPALYLPAVMMLLALGMRGVCFEFRSQIRRQRRLWDVAFAIGSAVAALMQGVILGTLLQGIEVRSNAFGGRVTDFATPYSFLCGLTVLIAYGILGAGWLRYKGIAMMYSFSLRSISVLTPIFMLLFATVSILSLQIQPALRSAWRHDFLWLTILLVIMIISCRCLLSGGDNRSDFYPFASALALVAAGVAGLTVIVFPNIVPFRMSLWDAASSSLSQKFVLVGACGVTPVILGYSFFAYWVFRGKAPRKGWDA